MEQVFNREVNQVAARDIVNYYNDGHTIQDMTESTLKRLLEQESQLKRFTWLKLTFDKFRLLSLAALAISVVCIFTAISEPIELNYSLIIAGVLSLCCMSLFHVCYMKSAVKNYQGLYFEARSNVKAIQYELTARVVRQKIARGIAKKKVN
ncbi:hypothetical protein K6Y31_04925 [Motilimonas cestriensis]|uniref:SMODS and SLOG-associating 2TM effector domain-containing protein n=1 Tax=Motilimonas cestriensis TaxID=2742685 RepID=A0ABS8W8S9_9GAMM|nr:hypothetical protein [Motilimonas cestriensis]MCE2594153.1 hypothetical protein [Motilimonas cestriensis]